MLCKGWGSARQAEVKRLVVPAGVHRVEDRAFQASQGIRAVWLPGSVRKIGRYAFEDCRGLRALRIAPGASPGEGLTIVADCAFQGCRALTELHLPGVYTA